MLDRKNFKKWVELLDHVGVLVKTDSNTGNVGVGFAELYDFDGVTPDDSYWEYVSMSEASTLT